MLVTGERGKDYEQETQYTGGTIGKIKLVVNSLPSPSQLKIKLVVNSLPSPSQLKFKSENTKITFSLSTENIEFFKSITEKIIFSIKIICVNFSMPYLAQQRSASK